MSDQQFTADGASGETGRLISGIASENSGDSATNKRRPGSKVNAANNFPSNSSNSVVGARRSSNSSNQEGRPVNEIINEIGWGKYNLMMNLIVGFVYFADGSEILVITTVSQALTRQWNLSAFMGAAIVSLVFCGAMVGALINGWMSANYGRRFTILVSLLGITTFSVLSAVVTHVWQLLVLRFLLGFSYGQGLPSCSVMAAEITPTSLRHVSVSMINGIFSGGIIFGSVVILIVDAHMEPDTMNWRLLLVLCGIPAAVAFVVGCFFLDESPTWLTKRDRHEEAQEVLNRICAWNGAENIDTSCRTSDHSRRCDTTTHENTGPLAEFLLCVASWRHRYTFIALCWMAFTWNMTLVGIQYCFPIIMERFHWNLPSAGSLLIISSAGIPSALTIAVFGHWWGRITAFIWSAALAALASFIFAVAIAEQGYFLYSAALAKGHVGLYIGLICLWLQRYFGLTLITYQELYPSEIFPTYSRATIIGGSTAVGRVAAICVPFVYEWFATFDESGASFFLLVTGWYGGLAVMCWFLPFESHGQDLSDVFEVHPDDEVPASPTWAKKKSSISESDIKKVNNLSQMVGEQYVEPVRCQSTGSADP